MRTSVSKLRTKQLYLYGPTATDKSSFIESLIGRCNMKYAFYPGVGKFFMQDFEISFHKLILFEEFKYDFYPPSMLKRLLEGRPFSYPVKGLCDKMINFAGPIIFVSNDNEVSDPALISRLLFVSASSEFWTSPTKDVKPYLSRETQSCSAEFIEINEDEVSENEKNV